MSVNSQNLLTNSHSPISFYFTNTHLKNPNFSLSLPSKYFPNLPHFQILKIQSSKPYNFTPLRSFPFDGTFQKQAEDGTDVIDFDAFLSIAEFLCLASSAVVSIGFAVNSAFLTSQKPIFVWLGSRVSLWQLVLLVGGMVISATIWRRQWRRICMGFSNSGGSGVNLVERIEKLEEDVRSSSTTIRVLSRQLEKLGIWFRVTRKTLRGPIAETAALAHKNSEATRALAMQEDILEKELGEIQQVLLAMQEQQQKQLELIPAISKTGKLWEGRWGSSRDQDKIKTSNSAVEGVKQMAPNQIEALPGQKEANNDRA